MKSAAFVETAIFLLAIASLSACPARAQGEGDDNPGGTSTSEWWGQGPLDDPDDRDPDWNRNSFPDSRDYPRGNEPDDRSTNPPEPSLIFEPTIGVVVGKMSYNSVVQMWSEYEEAAHESLVNHKDGSSAFSGYNPGMNRQGFKTFRTRGIAITIAYALGERSFVLGSKYLIGRTKIGRLGGWRGALIGSVVDVFADEIGDKVGGQFAVIGSLITNSDVIRYNGLRMIEIGIDPYTYEQPFSGWPSRPNW